MPWMNAMDIDEALDVIRHRAPEYLPYAQYLSDWRDIVNQNSDGWSYWAGGSRPANKLMELLDRVVQAHRPWGWTRDDEEELPTLKQMRRALSPIKACATRHKLPKPELRH